MTNDRDPESAAAYLTALWERTGMPPLSPDGPWLAGGACVRAITREAPADLDVRFASSGQLHEWCERAHVSALLGAVRRTIDIHVAHRWDVEEPIPTVSLIVAPDSFEPTLPAVLETHDLVCTQIGFDGERIVALPGALEDLATRRLRLTEYSFAPRSTLRRLDLYSARGFSCGIFMRTKARLRAASVPRTSGPSGT
jgi:hypothetical protein